VQVSTAAGLFEILHRPAGPIYLVAVECACGAREPGFGVDSAVGVWDDEFCRQQRRLAMHMHFSEAERGYIVDNPETDLLLTQVGLRLVDGFTASNGVVLVEANEAEEREFLAELKSEFVRTIDRVAKPEVLHGLVLRLLPDDEDITRITGYPGA
jgi:hypothetical protein